MTLISFTIFTFPLKPLYAKRNLSQYSHGVLRKGGDGILPGVDRSCLYFQFTLSLGAKLFRIPVELLGCLWGLPLLDWGWAPALSPSPSALWGCQERSVAQTHSHCILPTFQFLYWVYKCLKRKNSAKFGSGLRASPVFWIFNASACCLGNSPESSTRCLVWFSFSSQLFYLFSEEEYEKKLSTLSESQTSLQFGFLSLIDEVFARSVLCHSAINIPPMYHRPFTLSTCPYFSLHILRISCDGLPNALLL